MGGQAMGGFPFSLFDIGGRLSLYGFYALYTSIGALLVAGILVMAALGPNGPGWRIVAFAVPVLVVVSIVVLNIAMIRRLHDLGRSGWWLAPGYFLLVMFMGPVVLLEDPDPVYFHPYYVPALIGALLVVAVTSVVPLAEMMFQQGEVGENRYGPDPGG
jgi:uncharacterized membrane protein YhaH (DUF805 family)